MNAGIYRIFNLATLALLANSTGSVMEIALNLMNRSVSGTLCGLFYLVPQSLT